MITVTHAPSAPTLDHSTYLGGSDIASIVGCDPFSTALDCWARKTGRIVVEPTEPMHAGNEHEAAIFATYRRRCAHDLERLVYPGPGTLRSTSDPWRAATPDAIAWRGGRVRVVQAKLVGFGMLGHWGHEDEGADGVPDYVQLQVHWESAAALERFDARGIPIGQAFVDADVVASLGTETRIYTVPIDWELVGDLVDLGRAWWQRHVVEGEMPEATGGDRATLASLYPHPRRPMRPAMPAELELVQAYVDARAAAKVVEEVKEGIAAQLTAAIGDADGIEGPWGRATWKGATRVRTDWKAIVDELEPPASLVAEHTKAATERRLDVRLKSR